MFEFVNTTTGACGKDEESKRKIRSQAMKHFREKQRQAQYDTASKSTQRPHIILSSANRRAPAQDLHEICSSNAEDCTRHQPTKRLSAAHRPAPINPAAGQSPLPGPSIWVNQTSELSPSPVKLDLMLGLCRGWFRFLRPDLADKSAGLHMEGTKTGFPLPTCTMLLAANCLAAIGGLDAIDSTRSNGPGTLLKGKVLHDLQHSIQNPFTATSDETLSTLLFLTSYELYTLSPDTITHLRGLRSLLQARKSTNHATRWGGGLALEMLDLLAALLNNSEPLIVPPAEQPLLSDLPTNLQQEGAIGSLQEATESFQILYMTIENNRLACADAPSHYAAIRCHLNELCTLCQTCLTDCSTNGEVNETFATQFFDSLSSFSGKYCETGGEIEADFHHIARTIHQAFAILYNVIVNQHTFYHGSNETYVDGIKTAFDSIAEKSWTFMPFDLVFALLLGAAATKDASKRSFFCSYLGRCTMITGTAKWPQAKHFIVHFLRFQRSVQKSRPRPGRKPRGQDATRIARHSENVAVSRTAANYASFQEVLWYGALSWGRSAEAGLEKLLGSDQTFNKAMVNGISWRSI